jgi:hypothetical protein
VTPRDTILESEQGTRALSLLRDLVRLASLDGYAATLERRVVWKQIHELLAECCPRGSK